MVVVGMHRSGTSAITEMLHRLGLDTGPDDDLMTADDSNRRGYWESRALTDFQELLLQRLGGAWDAPPRLERGWESRRDLIAQVGRARRLLRRLYGGRDWAWKDPRTSLLLPFWRRVLGRLPPIVAIYRNPLEVAQSLVRRDGFSRAKSLDLWEAYNLAWVRGAQGGPALVLSYDRLLAAPSEAAASIEGFLRKNGFLARSHGGVENSVDRGLRHATHGEAELRESADATISQRALLDLLGRLEGEHDRLRVPSS